MNSVIRRKLRNRRKKLGKLLIADPAIHVQADALREEPPTGTIAKVSNFATAPPGAKIADLEAYTKWKEILKDPLLNGGRIVMATTGEAIDLGLFPSKFKEAIAHLNFHEKGDLTRKVTAYRSLLGSANIYKRQAFAGHKSNVFRLTAKTSHHLKILETERGAEMLELYGRMFTPVEVHEVVVRDFGMMISLEAVVKFREKHLEEITARIESFQRDFKDIRLAIKRGRLEELVYLYQRTKNKHLVTDNNADREFLLKLLEQVRKETEGDVLKIEGSFEHKVEASINLHLKEEVLDTINLTQIILGKVASRMNIAGFSLIKQLNDSYYAKFNGMVDDVVLDSEYGELTYPSAHNYDFDAIKTSYQIITKEEADEVKKVKEKQKEAATTASVRIEGRTIKERLLEKLDRDRKVVAAKGNEADNRMLEVRTARDQALVRDEEGLKETRTQGKKKTMVRRANEKRAFNKIRKDTGGRPLSKSGII